MQGQVIHELREFIHDAKSFVLQNKWIIKHVPLQLYYSALVFVPSTSVVRCHFENEMSAWIRPKPDRRSALLHTLNGHDHGVCSVAFSHDSAWLASASRDNTIKIWDTNSGECLETLKGHSNWVRAVAFSYDLTQLVSASDDNTIKIWDTKNGECLQTLKGHSGWIRAVTFSHDSTRLASASVDRTVKIWDTSSGECLRTLEGHRHWINSAVFSHDSAWLASASYDNTIKIWDTSSGECLQTTHVDKNLFNISFDATGFYLHTEIGVIAISASTVSKNATTITEPQLPQYQYLALSSDKAWITYHSKNLVWLPSEYRPTCSVISGKIIGIGTESGKVWICNVELNEP